MTLSIADTAAPTVKPVVLTPVNTVVDMPIVAVLLVEGTKIVLYDLCPVPES